MNIKDFGGNIVKQFALGNEGKEMLGSGPYEYYIYETLANEEIHLNDLRSFSVYILNKPKKACVTVEGIKEILEEGDEVQAENCEVKLTVQNKGIKLLIAGTKNSHPSVRGLFFSRHKDIYKVEKPWGHELWINGQHPCYALKQIFIKSGTKTSLQYHNFKHETNVLFKGTASLHFKGNEQIVNDLVGPEDIDTVQINPISSIDVLPSTLHRLEAVTDVLLYETSTPHLDDVIRVSDDNERPDGRINSEHNK